MITYEKVINAAEISGSFVGNSQSFLVVEDWLVGLIDGFGRFSGESVDDWFGGVVSFYVHNLDTPEGYIVLSREEGEQGDEFNAFTDTVLNGPPSFTANNGSFTFAAPAEVQEYGTEDNAPTNAPNNFEYSVTGADSNWSRVSVGLQSWQSTVLSGLTGRSTTQVTTQEGVPTTTEVESQTITTAVTQEVQRTTTTQITDSTAASWQPSAYNTVFFTGQTTALVYRSFSNALPVVWQGSLVSVTETVRPQSFVSFGGHASFGEIEGESVSGLTFSGYDWTRTTAGPAIINSTFPRIELFGSKITTTTRGFARYSTRGQVGIIAFTTKSQPFLNTATSGVVIGGENVTASFLQTTTVATDFGGYQSEDTVNGLTQSGSAEIQTTNGFSFAQQPTGTVAKEVTVGVRALSGGQAGSAVAAEGAGNQFFRHTESIVLAATAQAVKSGSTFTFYRDSYTARDTEGQTTQSTYGVEGAGETIWQTVGAINPPATIVGGPLKGNAVLPPAKYSTFAGDESGTVSYSAPTQFVWSAGDSTTAFLPALSVQTVVDNTAENVQSISRHLSVIIDD
jgi:hypothetical protein